MPHDTRDTIVDFVRRWSDRTEIAAKRMVGWMGLGAGKYHDWKLRYGKVNEHNALVPRDHWLEESEKQAIVNFHVQYPLEGYRRLTFMMLDRDVVAASPSSVYRVLQKAGRLRRRWNKKPGKKGAGFVQPLKPHEHRPLTQLVPHRGTDREATTELYSARCVKGRTSTFAARFTTCAVSWMVAAGSWCTGRSARR